MICITTIRLTRLYYAHDTIGEEMMGSSSQSRAKETANMAAKTDGSLIDFKLFLFSGTLLGIFTHCMYASHTRLQLAVSLFS